MWGLCALSACIWVFSGMLINEYQLVDEHLHMTHPHLLTWQLANFKCLLKGNGWCQSTDSWWASYSYLNVLVPPVEVYVSELIGFSRIMDLTHVEMFQMSCLVSHLHIYFRVHRIVMNYFENPLSLHRKAWEYFEAMKTWSIFYKKKWKQTHVLCKLD